VRVVLDRQGRIPSCYSVFDGKAETIVFTEKEAAGSYAENVSFVRVKFDEKLLENVFSVLERRSINSVLVEGGRELLQSIIDKKLWDEAYIETSRVCFGAGVEAPTIKGKVLREWKWGTSGQVHLFPDNYKIL
jgi:diaminohydroxyphosphoribosylaminopyrimidine deaminase/5-amino-6-(5-phosphoribosylamino)uracil reductase